MVMTMLVKNFFREIAATLPRLMSVIVVAALGVFMYVGMAGIAYNLSLISEDYYENQNVADFWISGEGLTKEDEKKVANIGGVAGVQSRVLLEARPVRDKDVTVALIGVSGAFRINVPYIKAGRLPESGREIALYDDFAKKHALAVGDSYTLQIKESEEKLTLTVCGLIRSPEYIYNVSGIDMIPDSYKLGFGYLKDDAFAQLLGRNNFNQICVKLKEGADADEFIKELDGALGKKAASVLSFTDNKRASMLDDGIKEIKAMTTSLPSLFFLISALIMFTTMSRIIENARMQIGTLKALGYSDLSIFAYYLSYSQMVVVFGVVLGVLPSMLITAPLMGMYESMMSLPDFRLRFHPGSIAQALVITNIFCAGTSFYICMKELGDMPAACIRPKQPKTGNQNLLERISFLWRRMTFTEKTIVRNIFRNKMRLVMCVAGVVGCMAVVITAFGMNDSNNKFFTMLFDRIHRYDIQVFLKSGVTDAQLGRIQSQEGIDRCEYQMDVPASFLYGGKKEGAAVTVVEDEISLMLLDISSQSAMRLPERGAVVSSVLARKLGIREGDLLRVALTGTNRSFSVEAAQILKNINGVYMGRTAWRALGQEYKPTAIYLKTASAGAVKERIAAYEFVLSAKQKSEVVRSVEVQLETMKVMVLILTLFGGVLAFVVLYNLGIMNYFERLRELATLMVLGFYDKEIRVLVLRENTIFTLAGILLGLPAGIWFHGYMIGSSETAGFEVDAYIARPTFLVAGLLTFGFSLLVNLSLGRRFREIDMIGALKSVE